MFLTLDDGTTQDPDVGRLLADAHSPSSLFVLASFIDSAPNYFAGITRKAGGQIQNHTVSHSDLATLSYDQQKQEICGASDVIFRMYGERPQLFRPPYGSFNDDTLRAAADCEIKVVVHWRALVQDGVMYYQAGDSLRPGNIVLMHFTDNFKQDLETFTREARRAHLTPQPLEAWLTVR